MSTGTTGVVGQVDGIVPVYDPTGRWCIWNINEVFQGSVGSRRYVPKKDDYVIDPATYTMYIVMSVDPITLLSELKEIRPANMSFGFTETDILFGVGPGTQADTYRVYLDKSVTPYVLAVDARLKIAGSLTAYAKIFKGAVLGSTGEVISRVYDASGNILSDQIPLEKVALDSHDNYAIKIVSVCYTLADLADGEVVTAVIYDDAGHVVSKRQLLVENTAFIRSVNADQKYVSHISLETSFLSPTLSHVIEFPLNVPLTALNLIGVVHYSDGSVLRLPVDGSKFKLFGIDQYVSTIIGQKLDLALSYTLAENEVAYGAVVGDQRYVTEAYSIQTIDANNSYSVKLFGYPIWLNEALGYEMHWYLFNLDRNVYFDVTPFVRFAENTGVFNPKGYGYLQRKAVTINLREVAGTFKAFTHTQLVDIILHAPPNNTDTAWLVSHEAASERPLYGDKLYAIKKWNGQNHTLNVGSALLTQEAWLSEVYSRTYPLIDRFKETTPPVPTHFEVIYGVNKVQFPIDQWNTAFALTFDLPANATIFIRFFKRMATTDLQLSMAAMIVGV